MFCSVSIEYDYLIKLHSSEKKMKRLKSKNENRFQKAKKKTCETGNKSTKKRWKENNELPRRINDGANVMSIEANRILFISNRNTDAAQPLHSLAHSHTRACSQTHVIISIFSKSWLWIFEFFCSSASLLWKWDYVNGNLLNVYNNNDNIRKL